MSAYIGFEAQNGATPIQTDNDGLFVIPSQVVAGATSTGVTYNMSVDGMTPSDDSSVKYDYVFDYTLVNAAAAASFCNAFIVSGANAYSTPKNTAETSAVLNDQTAVYDILLLALEEATAEAGQAPKTGAPTKGNLTGTDTIDSTLTSVLKQFVTAYTNTAFDAQYYSAAVGTQAGLSTDEVHIDLDDDTGVSALKRAAAALDAVKAGGAIRADATKLALQLPASNLRLYENSTTSALSDALALKGGDTVVLGFHVTLDNPVATCTVAASGAEAASNASKAVKTHPAQLEASSIEVDVGLAGEPSTIRPVEIAVRLHMPGSGAINGVRMGGTPAVVITA
jgi:hypothetical protein